MLPDPGAASRATTPARRAGELHRKGAPLAGGADHRNPPSVRLDDLPADPEAQAEAAELLARDGALEALEDPGLVGRLDPDAVVAHGEEDVVRPALQAHLDRFPRAVLGGVADQ